MNMRSFQIGNLTGVHPQPAAFKSALQGAVTIAEVLSVNDGLFARDTKLVPLAKAALAAGKRCEGYAVVIQDGSRPVQIEKSVFDDFEAITLFVSKLIRTNAFGTYADAAVTAAIRSTHGQMIKALSEIQPVTPVGQFAPAGMRANMASLANVGPVMIIPSAPIHTLVDLLGQIVAADMQSGMFGRNEQEVDRTVEIILGEREELSVEFAGEGLVPQFRNRKFLAAQLLAAFQLQEGRWHEVEGCEIFRANQHQVAVRFQNGITVNITSPNKDISTFGDINSFFAYVQSQLTKYVAPSQAGMEQISPATQVVSNWGTPRIVPVNVVSSTGYQATADNAVRQPA